MTPQALLHQIQADGVQLVLTPAGTRVTRGPGIADATAWHVNPTAFERFADYGAAEVSRRREVRARMLTLGGADAQPLSGYVVHARADEHTSRRRKSILINQYPSAYARPTQADISGEQPTVRRTLAHECQHPGCRTITLEQCCAKHRAPAADTAAGG